MSTSSVQVLGISTVDSDLSDIDHEQKSQSQLKVHGRIKVFDNSRSFDTVRISLKGRIKTSIGAKAAVERLPSSILVRKNVDFKPSYSASRQSREEQQMDFVLPLPQTKTVQKSSGEKPSTVFVPSMSLSVSSYVTRVTALKDRHLVEGSCEVFYWIEVELLRVQTEQIVEWLSCPIEVPSLHVPLKVTTPLQSGEEHIEQTIQQSSRRLSRGWFNPQPQAQLSIKIPTNLGTISSSSAKSSMRSRHLPIPVTIALDLASVTTQQSQAMLETDSIICSSQAHFYTSRTFATTNVSQNKANAYSNSDSIARNNTVAVQKLQLALPPLYKCATQDERTGASKYTTSMVLDLFLPESISNPSISTNLLSISYKLDLSLKFKFANNFPMRPCSAEFNLPLTLSAAQPSSLLDMQYAEPLAGLVENGLVVAPPPYFA